MSVWFLFEVQKIKFVVLYVGFSVCFRINFALGNSGDDVVLASWLAS